MYEVKRNRSSYHIDGMPVRSKGLGQDMGDHVSYAAESTCGALTRGRFEIVLRTEDVAEALAKAELGARVYNMKLCKNCEKAANEIIAAQQPATDLAAEAAAKLTAEELEALKIAIFKGRF